jgi:hypothetical protein
MRAFLLANGKTLSSQPLAAAIAFIGGESQGIEEAGNRGQRVSRRQGPTDDQPAIGS